MAESLTQLLASAHAKDSGKAIPVKLVSLKFFYFGCEQF